MLRQISRRGRLLALLRDSFHSGTTMVNHGLSLIAKTLFHSTAANGTNLSTTTTDIPMTIYERVLTYTNKKLTSVPYRDLRHLPHPVDARVLGRRAIPIRHWKHNGREYSIRGAHPGNSSISFGHDSSIQDAGFIEQIWGLRVDGQAHTLMVISLHTMLSPLDEQKNPYPQRPGLACQLVYSNRPPLDNWVVISPEQIIGHVAYYQRPAGSFGIQHATTVLVNSLHRYRDMLKFR
jgi:hypothetical protein